MACCPRSPVSANVLWSHAARVGDVVSGLVRQWVCAACGFTKVPFRGVVVGKVKGWPFTAVVELPDGRQLLLDEPHGVEVRDCVNHGQAVVKA